MRESSFRSMFARSVRVTREAYSTNLASSDPHLPSMTALLPTTPAAVVKRLSGGRKAKCLLVHRLSVHRSIAGHRQIANRGQYRCSSHELFTRLVHGKRSGFEANDLPRRPPHRLYSARGQTEAR